MLELRINGGMYEVEFTVRKAFALPGGVFCKRKVKGEAVPREDALCKARVQGERLGVREAVDANRSRVRCRGR